MCILLVNKDSLYIGYPSKAKLVTKSQYSVSNYIFNKNPYIFISDNTNTLFYIRYFLNNIFNGNISDESDVITKTIEYLASTEPKRQYFQFILVKKNDNNSDVYIVTEQDIAKINDEVVAIGGGCDHAVGAYYMLKYLSDNYAGWTTEYIVRESIKSAVECSIHCLGDPVVIKLY